MKKILFVILFCFLFLMQKTFAQTYKVFKGDTINRLDVNQKKQGLWRKYYSNDTLFSEGKYQDDIPVNVFHTFYKNGKPQSTLTYRKKSGIADAVVLNDSGGVMAKGKYIGHDKDSIWNYYDEEGKLSSTEIYQHGKKTGVWKIFYQDGSVSKLETFSNDQHNGPYKEFFQNGKPKIEAVMKNDQFEGVVTIYYSSGIVWQKGMYVNGTKEGTWIINDESGKKEKEEIFSKGNLMNPEKEEEDKQVK